MRLYQNVEVSISGGKKSARSDKQSAPIKEMKYSKFGIATAIKTEKILHDNILTVVRKKLLLCTLKAAPNLLLRLN